MYFPCFRFALALFALPCSVLGPVDLPPCVAHTLLPFIAGAPHLNLVRLLRALQRRHLIRPPASNNTSLSLEFHKTPKAQIYNTLSVLYLAFKSIKPAALKQQEKHGRETRAIREERSAKLAELYELEMLGRELGLISGRMVGRKSSKR